MNNWYQRIEVEMKQRGIVHYLTEVVNFALPTDKGTKIAITHNPNQFLILVSSPNFAVDNRNGHICLIEGMNITLETKEYCPINYNGGAVQLSMQPLIQCPAYIHCSEQVLKPFSYSMNQTALHAAASENNLNSEVRPNPTTMGYESLIFTFIKITPL